MDYTSFELKLKSIFSTHSGPKLLLKLINSPYRFNSNLHPFNVLTKIEQSFLKTQENSYYKFILNCAEEIFYSSLNDIEHINNSFKLDYVLNDDEIDNQTNYDKSEIVKFRSSIAFQDKQKQEITLLFAKKRDIFSVKKTDEFTEQILLRVRALHQAFPEWKIKYIVWFIDPLYTNSQEFFDNFVKQHNSENIEILFKYGVDLFVDYKLEKKWEEVQQNIDIFKKKNEDYFLKMPNLSTDKITLEFMVNMSNNTWEKLNSNNLDMVQLRKIIFDDENENSNFKKAARLRLEVLNDNIS
ncbi:hypothetical protein EG856_00210 [Mycoplasmopsis phocirhinis]|uniref:Uncharacterized protein n=1 Tax=Mycoplasmopsis phocirhinis TaxID=142650 RepID=A0A4P6MRB3_9BACT|nr:hypothetical protein [Mycoplasmopsis phocirhinis]QBF34361.1 hypothetical protein EG856_00210 [Mycoplasmopsis phocirhinis]